MRGCILFNRIVSGYNLQKSKNFTNEGYVFNLTVTNMKEIHKHINRDSFHPFTVFSQKVLNLILDAQICLLFPAHSGLRALQKSNVSFFPEENLEIS